jgi:hypothetical protein
MTTMALFECRTRLTLVLIGCALYLLEGLLKMVWAAFPVVEIIAAQGGLILTYLGVKSYTNVKGCAPKPIVPPTEGEAEGK